MNTLTLSDGTVLIPYHADEHSLLNTDVTQKLIDNMNSMQTMPTEKCEYSYFIRWYGINSLSCG